MSYVGAIVSNQNGGQGGTGVILTLPAGCQVGDDAFYAATNNISNSIVATMPSGHDLVTSMALANNNNFVVGHKKLTSADISAKSFTVEYGTGNRAIGVGVVERGIATTSYETPPTPASTTSTHVPAPTAATTVDLSPVYIIGSTRGSAPVVPSLVFPSGYTKVSENATGAASGAQEAIAFGRITSEGAKGSYGGADVATNPAGTNIIVATLALRLAAAPPSGPTYTYWDGSNEVTVTLSYWDGTTETPVASSEFN